MSDRLEKGTSFIHEAATATGFGTTVDVRGFRHVTLLVSGANGASGTVLFSISASVEKPDFTAAVAPDNHHTQVAVYDYFDAGLLDGATGIVVPGDTAHTLTVNTDQINWLNADISVIGGGDITVEANAADNR